MLVRIRRNWDPHTLLDECKMEQLLWKSLAVPQKIKQSHHVIQQFYS